MKTSFFFKIYNLSNFLQTKYYLVTAIGHNIKSIPFLIEQSSSLKPTFEKETRKNNQ